MQYAILSHKWGEEEVGFQAMQDWQKASRLRGFDKIQMACDEAVKDGLEYVWVDTCCINKDSSAELREAINSMYRWYENSSICYVFLDDVDVGCRKVKKQMRSSIWFTRGWTLQELIAPRELKFFDRGWAYMGSKESLIHDLAKWTGIDSSVLCHSKAYSSFPIAVRMFWASKRATTRVEDTAYCLMGIFGVNMPLLYGEGEKAFLRLQLEIIKDSDDHSVFAWPIEREEPQLGLLADTPAAFKKCRYIETPVAYGGRAAFSMTNRGLSIRFKAVTVAVDVYWVQLECFDRSLVSDSGGCYLGMFLRRLAEEDQYARTKFENRTFFQRSDSPCLRGIDKWFKGRLAAEKREIQVNVYVKSEMLMLNEPPVLLWANP